MDNLLYYHMLEGAPTIITKYSTNSKYIYVTTITEYSWNINTSMWDVIVQYESQRVMAPASPTHKVYTSYTESEIAGLERTEGVTLCRSYHLFDFSDVIGTVISAKMNVSISTDQTNPVNTNDIILNKCNSTSTLATTDFENIHPTSLGYSNIKTANVNGQFFNDIALTSTAITAINQKGLYRICVLDYTNDYLGAILDVDTASSSDLNASIVLTVQ